MSNKTITRSIIGLKKNGEYYDIILYLQGYVNHMGDKHCVPMEDRIYLGKTTKKNLKHHREAYRYSGLDVIVEK